MRIPWFRTLLVLVLAAGGWLWAADAGYLPGWALPAPAWEAVAEYHHARLTELRQEAYTLRRARAEDRRARAKAARDAAAEANTEAERKMQGMGLDEIIEVQSGPSAMDAMLGEAGDAATRAEAASGEEAEDLRALRADIALHQERFLRARRALAR